MAKNLSFEEYIKMQVEEGYISEDGTPLKCTCGCKTFKKVNIYNEEGWEVEYSLECKNESCYRIVGTWSYGHWQL